MAFKNYINDMVSAYEKSIIDNVYAEFSSPKNKSKLKTESDKSLNLVMAKIAKTMSDDLDKTLFGSLSEFKSTATTIDSTFSLKDFEDITKRLKELPRIATEIQVFTQGYWAIKGSLSVDDEPVSEVFVKQLYGINLIIIDKDDELNPNQARIKYNDGSSKIINIY